MERKLTETLDPKIWKLFDEYVHGALDRRGFLDGASKFLAAGVTATALLEALAPRFAEAQQLSPTDKRLVATTIQHDSPQGTGKVSGYLVTPAGTKKKGAAKKRPAVLVVHENRGLNPHIEDVTRRVALAGYVAFAPDALFPLGGYPGNEDEARALFQKLDQTKTREDFVASVAFLAKHPEATGKVAVVGFCYGGGIANMLATRVPTLAGAVPFYGMQAKPEDVPHIKAPLLIHYAETDERINAGRDTYAEALKANGKTLEQHTYPGTQHGFHNDTTPRYDKAAAALAWQRTLAFFEKNLRGK